MDLQQILENCEISLIEGEKKSGKLTFILSLHQENKNILLFTTYNKYIIEKRLQSIKNSILPYLNLNTIKKLSLKENWSTLKNEFGIEFFIKDIQKAIKEHNPQLVIFHRFENFFDNYEENELKLFIESILELKKEIKFKTFFTSIPNENNINIIENIENFSDVNILINIHNNNRVLKIKHSIYPLPTNEYTISFEDGKLILTNDNILIKNNTKPKFTKKSLLIISKNKEMREIFKYIFENKFQLNFAETTSEIINKILNSPDIIIYNEFENKMDFNVCNTLKENNLNSKLIYISNKPYIRGDDKIVAINNGCYDIFPFNFSILELISEVEKISQNNFYTQNIANLKLQRIITDKNKFCTILDDLYNNRIFFSLVNLKTSSNFSKNMLREKDLIFKENDYEYTLVLLNTRKVNIPQIVSKLFNQSQNFEIEYAIESPEFPHIKKDLCK